MLSDDFNARMNPVYGGISMMYGTLNTALKYIFNPTGRDPLQSA